LDEASGAAVPVVGGITLADTATGGATTGLLPNEPTSKGRRFIAANNSYISGGVAPFKYNLFSWEFWIKRTRTDVMEDVISQYAGGISFRINTDGTLEIQQSFTGIIANTKILKLLDTNAHHVVVTRNGVGGEVNFYVDGVREIGTPQSLYSADISSWTNYAIFVGSTWGTYSFDGTFDEFAIYPTILTQAQIQNHYDIATHVPTTVFGSLDFPISFSKDVRGLRKAFGQVALPVSFVKDVKAQRKTFGQISSPLIFGKAVSGQRKTFGQITFPITSTISTAGVKVGKILYGVVAFPITFTKDVKGVRKTFGQTASSIIFNKDVKAVRKTFGQISLPITFTKDVGGRNWLYGQLSMQTLFGKEVSGRRKTFGQLALPLAFSKAVAGQKKTFGRIALPISMTLVTDGLARARQYGQVSTSIIFNKQIAAQRKTFGQITSPLFMGIATQGQRRTFGKVDFPIDVFIELYIEQKETIIILNDAENIYLGALPVLAVYIEDQKVWPNNEVRSNGNT
jgi:hypothetical protein